MWLDELIYCNFNIVEKKNGFEMIVVGVGEKVFKKWVEECCVCEVCYGGSGFCVVKVEFVDEV